LQFGMEHESELMTGRMCIKAARGGALLPGRLTADIVVASKLALLDLLDRFRSLFDELVDAQLEQTPQNESSLSGKDADANSLTEGTKNKAKTKEVAAKLQNNTSIDPPVPESGFVKSATKGGNQLDRATIAKQIDRATIAKQIASAWYMSVYDTPCPAADSQHAERNEPTSNSSDPEMSAPEVTSQVLLSFAWVVNQDLGALKKAKMIERAQNKQLVTRLNDVDILPEPAADPLGSIEEEDSLNAIGGINFISRAQRAGMGKWSCDRCKNTKLFPPKLAKCLYCGHARRFKLEELAPVAFFADDDFFDQ